MPVKFPTRNDLTPETREAMIDLLNSRLADAVDLAARCKHAHWNVKGPHFAALHALFDRLAADLSAPIDDIAERAVQLGGVARGTVRQAAAESTLPEYAADLAAGPDHLRALVDSIAVYARNVRSVIDRAAELGDADTADLFTGVSRGADKALWLTEAHLQSER